MKRLFNAIMSLKEGEYVVHTLVDYLNENFKKNNGKSFTRNDVEQYIIRGNIPHFYTDQKIIEIDERFGIKIFKLQDSPKDEK